jgi:choline dehydrogenase
MAGGSHRPSIGGSSRNRTGNGATETLRRVKGIGGTSWMTRFALRGSTIDFDRWAAAGNPGWASDDVLPGFRRLEHDLEFGDRPWHGDRGPISITRYPNHALTDIHAAAVEAAQRLGFGWAEDANGPDALGIGRLPMSSRDGSRVTAADGYLPRESLPHGLEIRSDAQVADLVFEGRRAIGVRMLSGEVVHGDLIVVSGGTYGSPAILLRSGIGPATHLHEIGIRVAVDLPGVGEQLADHAAADIVTGWQGTSREEPRLHTFATLRSEVASADDPPDLGLWMVDPMGDPQTFEIGVVLMKPRSRGRVTLRSADPTDNARIQLPDLDDRGDVRALAEGLRRASAIAESPEVRRLSSQPSTALPSTDAELEAYVLANAYSVPHVVGTCAMGPDPSLGAVVDTNGRVHGIDGLHVVDASIMPDAPSGFPHIVTIMIAETIAARLGRDR